MEDEDIRTMVTFGQGLEAPCHFWVEENKAERGKITAFLLFPAAKAGELETLETFIKFGDLTHLERDDKNHLGWNLYHYAVYGYQINCSYLLEGDDPQIAAADNKLTPDEARQVQMDIIYALHKNGAPVIPLPQHALGLEEEDILHPSPLHPSLMALGYECSFSEAAILIDMLTVLSVNHPVDTPGLDNINVTSNNDHRRALYHLIEWAYNRHHLDVLTFCHNRYLSLFSNSVRIRSTNYPIFLAAVRDRRLEVIEMIFANHETRPLPDRILSRPFLLGKDKDSAQASPISIACQRCLEGEPAVMKDLLSHAIIGKQLVNLALSDLSLVEIPLELFHVNLISLSLSGNQLTQLPPVQYWQCDKLQFLNISGNQFTIIPPGLFSLPKLSNLNASINKIGTLDLDMWTAPSLKHLYLSSNLLRCLPVPPMDTHRLSLHPGDLVSPGATKKEIAHGLRQSFVDLSLERDEDFHKTQGGYSLEFLDLSDNQFESIPSGLPCLAPMLFTLKLSQNRIINFGAVAQYPTLLKSLNLSNNGGKACIAPSPASPRSMVCLQSSPDEPKRCTHADHAHLVNLQHLNVSSNQLEEVVIETAVPLVMAGVTSFPGPGSPTAFDKSLLYPKLQSLYLNDNALTSFPIGIHKQERLGTLDVSNNIGITKLPAKLHALKNLIGFRYRGIGDPIIATLDTFKDTAQLLYFLRARELDAVPNDSMRLFVIGHSNKGKSTVLKALRGEKFAKEAFANPVEKTRETVGIEVGMWNCMKNKQTIHFHTWDFAGQDEYYITHQCFLTNRALYLLVWKLTDKEQGLEGLPVWLRNLQAAAPYAQVIVIGTHLDVFRRNEGRNAELLLERYRQKILTDFKYRDKTAPKIHGVFFVGFEQAFFNPNLNPLKYDELHDKIFDVAKNMEIPRDADMPASFSIKLLNEKIPKCYLQLDKVIKGLVANNPDKPIYKKTDFCDLAVVKRVINDEQEIDAAMHFLHNMGRILHFPKPVLEDYYIVHPQWWFDACALVISPNNVSNLVMAGDEPGSGLLKFKAMQLMFQEKKYTHEYAMMIFSFLHQYGVLLPVDKETALVPSLISPIPTIKLFTDQGYFPRSNLPIGDRRPPHIEDFFDHLPANLRSLESSIKVDYTGLVYRRLFLLPPLPAGFWSKLITLCLQKNDFVKIISSAGDVKLNFSVQGHGSYYNLEGAQIRWRYWKTGIIMDMDGNLLLTMNSLKMDEFMDPMDRSVISATFDKVKHFHLVDSNGDVLPLTQYNEVIEVVTPEVDLKTRSNYDQTVSAKLLAKALEMIDEVLKGHCETLAENGIFTVGDMMHIVPCPICFGERDTRSKRNKHASLVNHPRLAQRIRTHTVRMDKKRSIDSNLSDALIVFSIDQCIRSSMTTDYIECPKHKDIELEYLVPDIMFKDLSKVKLDRTALTDPQDSDGSPVGCGCFGVVYHKLLRSEYEFEHPREVAVKEFRSSDMDYDAELEVVKSYADMRYELNKLSAMEHNFIVQFVGLLSNPWSFILEWAPLMSLEKIRKSYEEQFKDADINYRYFCPVSLYLILLQVTDGLHYLHTPPIGIIHSDLKLSNILAYRFPNIDHVCCYDAQDRGRCSKCLPEMGGHNVLVKLGDMGVCVNPAAHQNDALGVKRFAPESLRFDSKITEKVDIFCLALCLYELMTLRGLPPRGISEQDYKNLIKKNWRPSFHSKDPTYPVPLYTCLEQCWQHDSNMRPSARQIRDFLEATTGLFVKAPLDKRFQLPFENMHHLLDTYQISVDTEITHVSVLPDHTPLTVCTAVRQGNSSIVLLSESANDGDSDRIIFKTNPVLQKVQDRVTSLFLLPNKTIFVGREGGDILYLHSNDPPCTLFRELCTRPHRGDAIFIRYLLQEDLLIYGFNDGQLHIIRAPLNILSQLTNMEKIFCQGPKEVKPFASAYEMVFNEGESFEVWCASEDAVIEISYFPLQDGTADGFYRKVSLVKLGRGAFVGPTPVVTKLYLSPEASSMFMLIEDQIRRGGSCSICEVGVVDKTIRRYWTCAMDVASFFITQNQFIFGTSTGDVLMMPLDQLKSCKGIIAEYFPVKLPSHIGKVSGLAVINGAISVNGYTSLFPTFLGRQREKINTDYLLTVGEGTLSFRKISSKAHKNENSLNGTCINLWLM